MPKILVVQDSATEKGDKRMGTSKVLELGDIWVVVMHLFLAVIAHSRGGL